MEEKKYEITLLEKAAIFTNWTLKACGIAFLLCCFAVYKGYRTPFQSLEVVQVYAQLDDLAHATMAAQEDILELHKKVKK
jgi:hypothetical protein